MVIGFFARPDHPIGYGFPPTKEEKEKFPNWTSYRAHGYVCLVVVSPDWETHQKVINHLKASWNRETMSMNHPDPWHRGDEWYAGPYEPVFAFEGEIKEGSETNGFCSKDMTMNSGWRMEINKPYSYGDNRAFAYLTAEEALKA